MMSSLYILRMYIKGKVTLNFNRMRTKNKIEKKCYRSHPFFVDKTSVLKFESSQGDTVYFFYTIKTTSNKLELQQTYIYFIK